jgi:hypothetical protein
MVTIRNKTSTQCTIQKGGFLYLESFGKIVVKVKRYDVTLSSEWECRPHTIKHVVDFLMMHSDEIRRRIESGQYTLVESLEV